MIQIIEDDIWMNGWKVGVIDDSIPASMRETFSQYITEGIPYLMQEELSKEYQKGYDDACRHYDDDHEQSEDKQEIKRLQGKLDDILSIIREK